MRGGLSSRILLTPYSSLFSHQVLLHFETEHQFKQKDVIAEAEGSLRGPTEVRVSPVVEFFVKTRQRQYNADGPTRQKWRSGTFIRRLWGSYMQCEEGCYWLRSNRIMFTCLFKTRSIHRKKWRNWFNSSVCLSIYLKIPNTDRFAYLYLVTCVKWKLSWNEEKHDP